MKKDIIKYYLRWPLMSDALISAASSLILSRYVIECPPENDRTNILNLMSSIISTCVSLAGFILAALTIIVTFKSNLKAKGVAEADDALDLILSSKHYDSIVSVFKIAIIEFVVVTVILYFAAAASSQATISALFTTAILAIIITALTIWRSLFVLFRLLKLEKSNIQQKRD